MSGAGERAGLGDVMRGFLEKLPAELAEVVAAAAVAHAFDAGVLAAVLGVERAEAERACADLQEMSFVQAMGEGTYALHEMVRDFLLDELWGERREKYRDWSRRAAEHFERRSKSSWIRALCRIVRGNLLGKRSVGEEDATARLEAVYHWLVADPERGADLVWDWGARWNNTFQFERVEALVQLGLEHDAAGRLAGRARGWIFFRKGQTHVRYSENRAALESLEAGLEAGRGDRQLEANCTSALGHVERMLGEYEAARERYQEAQAIYRAIGPRLGEANCTSALGHVERVLGEYEAARERYREALPIYRAIGHRLGEANCIYRLGELQQMLGEYEAARERYEEALPIYRAIGHRLGEANCIYRLGDVQRMLGEYEAARKRYEEAQAIYRAIGHRLGDANCIYGLGDVQRMLGEYEPARERYEEALDLYRSIFPQDHPDVREVQEKLEEVARAIAARQDAG